MQRHNFPIEQILVNLPQLTDLYTLKNNVTNLVNIRTLSNETNSGKYFDYDTNDIRFVPPQTEDVTIGYLLHKHT